MVDGIRPFLQDGTDGILITDRAITAEGSALVFHPPVLALGIGCERGADAKELIDLVEKTLTDAGLSSNAVACVASVDVKADEAALHALAAHLAVPARFFPPARWRRRRRAWLIRPTSSLPRLDATGLPKARPWPPWAVTAFWLLKSKNLGGLPVQSADRLRPLIPPRLE